MATISSSATHGRGFWVIDDISALRQITDTVAASDAYLFKPADAINAAPGRRQRHADAEGRAAGAEPAQRRGHRLLPEDRGDRSGHARDSRRRRRDGLATFTTDAAARRMRRRGGGARGGGAADAARAAAFRTRRRCGARRPSPSQAAAGMHRVTWNSGRRGRSRGRRRGRRRTRRAWRRGRRRRWRPSRPSSPSTGRATRRRSW